jgi:hypothetical protein
MPKPLAICIEDVGSQSKTRYMRCVALPGRQPGLCLDDAGKVLWRSDAGVSCELWVSADERLVLYRPEGVVPVTLHRAGRSLDVPCGKPVFVIDKDEIDVSSHRLRIHVHGQAPTVAAPSPLPSRPRSLGRLARAATAAAIAGTVVASGCCPEIEIRDDPPKPPAPTAPPPTIEIRDSPPEPTPPTTPPPTIEVRDDPPEIALPEITVAGAVQGEWTAAQAYDVEGERTWITGTLTIAGSSYSFESSREAEGPSVQGVLDFLFDTPAGEVTIEYADGVTPGDAFDHFAPGDTLAVCTFRAGSEALGEFLIVAGEAESIQFQSTSGDSEETLWRVTKQVSMDTGQ